MEYVCTAFDTALKAVLQDKPNASETNHQGPRDWHPCFYGCYDWHSAVHSHWLIVRCLRRYRDRLPYGSVRQAVLVLNQHLDAAMVAVEIESLAREQQGWECPYGFAWLLRLAAELGAWAEELAAQRPEQPDVVDAAVERWAAAVLALATPVRSRFLQWAEGLQSAERAGLHGNTAFALRLGLQYARARGDGQREWATLSERARFLFARSREVQGPVPGAAVPFLSPELVEAQALLEALESDEERRTWATSSEAPDYSGLLRLKPSAEGDPHDIRTCHLIGRDFAVAEGLAQLARFCGDEHREPLLLLARAHMANSVRHLGSGGWMGDHWVGSFALLAVEALDLTSLDAEPLAFPRPADGFLALLAGMFCGHKEGRT